MKRSPVLLLALLSFVVGLVTASCADGGGDDDDTVPTYDSNPNPFPDARPAPDAGPDARMAPDAYRPPDANPMGADANPLGMCAMDSDCGAPPNCCVMLVMICGMMDPMLGFCLPSM